MQRFVSNRFFVARLLVIFSTALILAGCHPWDDDDDPVASNSAPSITSNGGGDTANINSPENQTAVTTVTYSDSDVPADTISYNLSGIDATEFAISSSGILTFLSAPDFENPTDDNTDNIYEVTVIIDDGNGGTDSQAISVTVTMSGPTEITVDNTLRVSRAILSLLFISTPIPAYCDVFDCSQAQPVALASAAGKTPVLSVNASAFVDETLPHDCASGGYFENTNYQEVDLIKTPGDFFESTFFDCDFGPNPSFGGGGWVQNGTLRSETTAFTGNLQTNYTENLLYTLDQSSEWYGLSWFANPNDTLVDQQIADFDEIQMFTAQTSFILEISGTSSRTYSDGREIFLNILQLTNVNDYSQSPSQWLEFLVEVSHTDFGFDGTVILESVGQWVPVVNGTAVTYDGTVRIYIEGGGFIDGSTSDGMIRLTIDEDGDENTPPDAVQDYTWDCFFYGECIT